MVELPVSRAPQRLGPDLLGLLGVRRFLRWRYARLAIQIPILLLAVFVIVDGFTGRPLAPRNLATTAVWLHYRGLVVLALLIAGNLFCAACPLMLTRGAARFTKTRFGFDVRWPSALRSKGVVIALTLLFFYAYEAFSLWSSPWLTAWLAIGYFAAAWVIDSLFPAGTFCRYVCPLGNFNFALASVAPTQIATLDPSVCDRCPEKPCLHGRISDAADHKSRWTLPDGRLRDAVDGPRRAQFIPLASIAHANGAGRFPGCETGLFVPEITSNMDCTLCFNCLRACPHDNVGLRLRVPWHEAVRDGWHHRGRRSALLFGTALAIWGVLNAFAMVPAYYALADSVAAILNTRAEWWVLMVLYAFATLLGFGVAFGVAALADLAGGVTRPHWGAAFDRWAYVLVVIGVGFWAAHYLFHFLTGALSIVPVAQHFFAWRGFAVEPAWGLAQRIPSAWLFSVGAGIVSLAGGVALVVAARIALRDFGQRGILAMWVMGLFVVVVTVLEVLLLGQPMEMRGTLLGPLPIAP